MAKALQPIRLVETRRGCAVAERYPRYDVLLNGVLYGQLYFNTKGYVGYLPTPNGAALNIGEHPIATYRKEVSRLNREYSGQPV
jgi:hypothetical protein